MIDNVKLLMPFERMLLVLLEGNEMEEEGKRRRRRRDDIAFAINLYKENKIVVIHAHTHASSMCVFRDDTPTLLLLLLP